MLVRMAEMNTAQTEREMKEDCGIDDKDPDKKKGGWGDIGKP